MKKHVSSLILVLLDIAAFAVSVFLAVLLWLDFSFSRSAAYLSGSILWPALICATYIIINAAFRCYSSAWMRCGTVDLLRFTVSYAVCVVLWTVLKALKLIDFSGAMLLIAAFINYLFAVAVRLAPRTIAFLSAWFSRRSNSSDFKKALIIGCGDSGRNLAQWLLSNPELGIEPVAFIDNDSRIESSTFCGLRIVGGEECLPKAIKEYGADLVISALPSAGSDTLRRLYELTKETDAGFKVYSGIRSYAGENRPAINNLRIEDLVNRGIVELDKSASVAMLSSKTVLVTGGAGSIGSELCRQILAAGAARLIIFDFSENGLYELDKELKKTFPADSFVTALGSIRDKSRLKAVFEKYRPDYVFHAAAHKHVPMMEINPLEAVKNNVFGTANVLQQCVDSGVKRCILISSDKAVNSSNIMGATKHICELLITKYNRLGVTEMAAVRFGNVLGSSGSVIPLFKEQIAAGGPVTVTHPEITRYFMTIPEAVSLVLQAGALAKGGEIFVLDMGQPMKIVDLAYDMIRLAGLIPGKDIKIKFTGLRPGEKLFEELFPEEEKVGLTEHDKIFVCSQQKFDPDALEDALGRLRGAVEREAPAEVEDIIFSLLPSDYRKA